MYFWPRISGGMGMLPFYSRGSTHEAPVFMGWTGGQEGTAACNGSPDCSEVHQCVKSQTCGNGFEIG